MKAELRQEQIRNVLKNSIHKMRANDIAAEVGLSRSSVIEYIVGRASKRNLIPMSDVEKITFNNEQTGRPKTFYRYKRD